MPGALFLQSFPGQRQGSLVFHGGDGLFYHLSNNRPNRRFAYFRCIHNDSVTNYCPGTAKGLLERNVLFHLNGHSHPPNVHYPLARSLRSDVIARVRAGDQTSFREIIQQEGQRYPIDARIQVASGPLEVRLHAIRSHMRPKIPRNLGVLGACLMLPQYQHLTRCTHEPDSIYAGMCGRLADGTLSLVFISPEMRAFMETRSMIFVDGTEKRKFRKPKASQIYVFSTAWRFHVITMARAIMQTRTEEAYVTLLEFMKTLMPNLAPRSVKCDFEDAQVNAFRRVFPGVSVEGCLWHYDVAVWQMARSKGLRALIFEEAEVEGIVRAVGALPLLPGDDIRDGLIALGTEARRLGWMPQLKSFFKYMNKEWMPKCHILSVKDSFHRTNNVSESSNKMLNKELKVTNPNCYNVVRAFVNTNERAMADIRTLAALLSPGRGRRLSALRNDAYIKRLTMDYDNGDINIVDFLKTASYRMKNVFDKVFR